MGSSILLCSCCQMEWKLFTSCFLWVSSCLWITGTVSIKKNTKRNSYQMQAGFHFFVKQKFLKLHRSTYFIWTGFYSCPVHIWSSLKTNPTKPLAVNHIAEEKQVKTLICRRCSFAHCRNPSFVLSRTLWLSKLGCFGFLLVQHLCQECQQVGLSSVPPILQLIRDDPHISQTCCTIINLSSQTSSFSKG